MKALLLSLSCLAFVACSDSSGGAPDAAADAFFSICGHPGDQGNSKGIGKFCNTIQDCFSTPTTTLCATLGDPNAHFCTATCDADGGAAECGENAHCQCGSGSNQSGCGCFPDSCGQ